MSRMANKVIHLLLILAFIKSGSCVYRYYMDTMCGQTFNLTSLPHETMGLKLTQSATYAPNMNCALTLTTGLAKHFVVRVESFSTEVCQDNLKVMEGELTSPIIESPACGAPVGRVFRSFGSKVTLQFVSDVSAQYAGFSLHIEAIVGEPDATGYMEYSCGQTLDFSTFNLDSFRLRLTPNAGNNQSLNCSLLLTTSPSDEFDIDIRSTDIENCAHCTCDWLEIRDGNSRKSSYVAGIGGKICGIRSDLTSGYRTTGNSLYLLFISDPDGARQGFDITITSNDTGKSVSESTTSALTIPTTKSHVATTAAPLDKVQETISVHCNENAWAISVNMDRLRKLYPDAKASDIYLGENRCTGIELAGVVLFQQSLENCLSGNRLHNGVSTFTNELIYAEHDPKHPFIIRHYKWTIGVECDVLANGTVSGSFLNQLTTQQSIPASQHPVNISFYLDPNFSKKVSGDPLRAATGTNVYVKVYTTTSDWSTVMKVQSCYTMPSPNATVDKTYSLIKDGCEVDTNTHIISQQTHETRFVFEDFEYASRHDGLYMFCDAIFCASSDWSTHCRQTCAPVIRRSIRISN